MSVSEQFQKLIVNHFTNVKKLENNNREIFFLERKKVKGFRLVNCELQTVNYFTTLVGNVWRFFLALHLTMRYFKNTIWPGFEMEHNIFMKYYN